jgi:hypothetical protein
VFDAPGGPHSQTHPGWERKTGKRKLPAWMRLFGHIRVSDVKQEVGEQQRKITGFS